MKELKYDRKKKIRITRNTYTKLVCKFGTPKKEEETILVGHTKENISFKGMQSLDTGNYKIRFKCIAS